MRNDRLILHLIKSGTLTACAKTGNVVYRGKVRGYVKTGDPLGGPGGYLRFEVYRRKKRRCLNCHRVVWIVANGLPPKGFEINHINGDKADNRLDNLEAVPGWKNAQHREQLKREEAPY